MTRQTVLSGLGLVSLVVVALAYLHVIGVRTGPPDDRIELSMTVEDANGLVAGSGVLLRGMRIGEVTETTPSVNGAKISLYLDPGTKVPVDSEIKLGNLSALSESYIGILPRKDGGPYLSDGVRLSTEQVTQPPSISQLSASVVRVLNQSDPVALASLISEADEALPDPTTALPNLSRASAVLATTIAGMPGQGTEVLRNMQSLLANAGFVAPAIRTSGPQIADMGAGYQKLVTASVKLMRRTGAPESIRDVGKFLDRFQKLLDESGADIGTLTSTLLPTMTATGQALRTVDAGRLLDSVLGSIDSDGTVSVRLLPPS